MSRWEQKASVVTFWNVPLLPDQLSGGSSPLLSAPDPIAVLQGELPFPLLGQMCLSHPWSFSGYAASSSSQLLPFLLVPAPGKVENKQGAPHSTQIHLQVDQSGLGLPSRDYYLNKTENEKVSLPSLPRSAHPAIPEASETWLLQRAQFPEGQQAALGRLGGEGAQVMSPSIQHHSQVLQLQEATLIPSLKKTMSTAASVCGY